MVKVLRYKPSGCGFRFLMVSLEFFSDNFSGRTMALGSTQPGGEGGRCVRLTLSPSCAVVMNSGNLNFLGPFGTV
jgi:hypothetical protein